MKNSDGLDLYQQAFLKMDTLVYIIDINAKLLCCNDNLAHLLGFQAGEFNIYPALLQKGLLSAQQIQHFQKSDMDALFSGKKKVGEQTMINSDGTVSFFEISRTPLFDEFRHNLGLMVSMHDITAQKLIEQQLADLKAQMRYTNTSSERPATKNEPEDNDQKLIKILLIEDNVITQKIEKKILMSCRCLADVVATPAQVDKIFEPGKYDLVLVDIGLEQGNGYQVTAALRKMEGGSHHRVPIIALTGYDPSEVGFDCDDAEMDGILRKPLTAIQAKQLIQRFIRHVDIPVQGLKEFRH